MGQEGSQYMYRHTKNKETFTFKWLKHTGVTTSLMNNGKKPNGERSFSKRHNIVEELPGVGVCVTSIKKRKMAE